MTCLCVPTRNGQSSANVAASVEKPKPQIFAIMRNGHEVIRGGMLEVKQAIANDDTAGARVAWEKLSKFQVMHKTMEEGDGTGESPMGFFKYVYGKRELWCS